VEDADGAFHPDQADDGRHDKGGPEADRRRAQPTTRRMFHSRVSASSFGIKALSAVAIMMRSLQ